MSILINFRFLWSWLRLSQYFTRSLTCVGVICRDLFRVGLKGSGARWWWPCIAGHGEVGGAVARAEDSEVGGDAAGVEDRVVWT